MNRKKKLLFIQLFLVIIATSLIFFTYTTKEQDIKKIISKETKEKVRYQIDGGTDDVNVFYNVEYSGFDLSGNRYILKSKEASSNRSDPEVLDMINVEGTFFFKDNTVLKVYSKEGVYNNLTLDIIFKKKVKSFYENSILFANQAKYLNEKSLLMVEEDVKILDTKGTLMADKIIFDLKAKTIKVQATEDNKIKTNVNLK
jgi:hypothetical protein|tara:strand:- start:6017 stop:6616 length:600 start_codon:yes stop_codon:yes gene_type:complete